MIVGCSYESHSPQALFEYEIKSNEDSNARLLLYKISIDNNLLFTDSSHTYPSGTSTLIAVAERPDGLKLILGGSAENKIHLAIHCHNECKEWKNISKLVHERFNKKWKNVQ